jgi:hypothetical protein
MSNPKKDCWVVVKDQQVTQVVVQSVHDSEKSALSAQRRDRGRVVKVLDYIAREDEILKEY